MTKQFLLASDFDQTLSFNDSGVVLSELIGFHGFHDKVSGLSEMNLVQQGAELSYLIQSTEFAFSCCNLEHSSPFLCVFYHYAASN